MSLRPRVCLIDDDIMVREALALGLSDAGFEVVAAPGAAAGLDICLREPINAIVTDLNMPGTGGVELISEVRSRWPDLPIIAISGAAFVDERNVLDHARAMGANACMVKPFRARDIAAQLQELLDSGVP